ncbi:condensin complex subunit 3 [Diachasma alloeum]|uniref:condensin complex subunit 3 n=1 Tax=Diachasma alloeum TaxID=454923 RepID=UPI0007383581|nr:condensin complex subunit 3 [Diachasma alloeum]
MARNPRNLREVITDIFNEAQQKKAGHRKQMKKLKEVYESSDFDHFVSEFIRCLKYPFVVLEKYPAVENILDFAAKFAMMLQPVPEARDETSPAEYDEEEDELNPLLQKLLEFCLEHHSAVDVAVRYRCCYFINLLLSSMSEDAYLSDQTCDDIREAMTERLLDKSPKVRVMAIYAIHRMQDPNNHDCPIIKMYIFHMSKDGSAEVRKAVIQCTAKNQRVLQAVLERIRDIDDSVRRSAHVFFSKVTVKSLTIKQRQLILRTGLNDSAESVRKVVRDMILPMWLDGFQKDYCKLLYGLDVEIEPELGSLVLNTLFERANLDTLFKQLPLDRDAKLIPIDDLTGENVFFWRCFIQHLHKKSGDEAASERLQDTIPELTNFCRYIRDFQSMMIEFAKGQSDEDKDVKTQKMSQKFGLLQVFEIAKTYDLGDEVGRGNLRQLIEDTLMSEICTTEIIESVVKYYEKVVPDVPSRLTSLAHAISEIRVPTQVAENVVEQVTDEEVSERLIQCQKLKNTLLQRQNDQDLLVRAKKFTAAAEIEKEMEILKKEIEELSKSRTLIVPQTQEEAKNDSETMLKCLRIMFTMAQASSVTTLTSTLRSLFDNLALPSIDHEDGAVQAQALKAVGVCLFLDGELAKKHLMMYLVAMTSDQENQDLWQICLAVIFDMFLRYGLDHFQEIISTDRTIDNSRQNPENSKRHGTRLYSSADDTTLTLETETGDNRHNLIKILLDLIDHLDKDIRTAAVTGFCKLLLHGKLKSNALLSTLIIRLYDPVSIKDVELRGSLVNFFRYYPSFTPDGCTCLQQAFIPTLKKLAENPYNSSDIDPYNIAKFIIDLTSSSLHKPGKENYTAHNQLALDILKEIAEEDSEIDVKTLLKSLKQLIIRCEDDEMKNRMREAVDKVIEMVNPSERAALKTLEAFRRQFELPEAPQGDGEQAEPERPPQEAEPIEEDEPEE